MDIRKVKKLIELLNESGIAEIEIIEGEESVRISRYAAGDPATPVAAAPPVAAAAPAPIATPVQAPPAVPGLAVPAADSEDDGFLVIAPMVGTYYGSSSPGTAPYVQVGDRINEGDTLCIIEAMKMMNQIEADTSGVIKSIRMQDGEPVEYGQTLFVIDQRQSE